MLRELTLRTDDRLADPLADALFAAGALAVSIADADAETGLEQPLFGEPGAEPDRFAWRHSILVVLVEGSTDPSQVLAAAAAALGIDPPAIETVRPVADADWVRLTQSQFPATHIAGDLWIVPTWLEPPQPDALNIRLDPGVAFGTGSHPTTQACLRWLVRYPPRARRVLDYGCGSGILAIAAAKLGAREVAGTDIDPQALEAARANARTNGVRAHYTAPDRLPTGPFDLVLANILAKPLQTLAPTLLARVSAGGHLVLAGLLERQAEALIDAYRQVDPAVRLDVTEVADGWACLAGERR
jgi:ribosomal protein L11 methyltransferase